MRPRTAALTAIGSVLAAGAILFGSSSNGGINVIIGGTPTPVAANTANVWVVTSGGTCSARQSTATTLASATAGSKCTSFTTACGLVSAGDTVRIQEGTYGDQTIPTTCGGSAGNRVTFDAQNGSTGCNRRMIDFVSVTSYTHNACPVGIGDFNVQGHDLNVKNLSSTECLCFPASSSASQARITTTNIHSLEFWMTGTDISITSGEAGGWHVCQAGNGGTTGPWPRQDIGHVGFAPGGTVSNMTIDGYLIHDLYDISGGVNSCGDLGGGPHSDCLQINHVNTIVVKNSQFWNCATADIQSNDDEGEGYANISYVGNFFGKVYTAGNAAEMGTTSQSSCTGTFIQAYNTYRAGAGSQVCGLGTATFIFEGNLQMDDNGPVGWETAGASSTVDYNVTTATQGLIGTHGKTCTASFANATDVIDGFKLNSGDTCASNAGKPSSSVVLATDIEGGTRNSTPEAGADELGVP